MEYTNNLFNNSFAYNDTSYLLILELDSVDSCGGKPFTNCQSICEVSPGRLKRCMCKFIKFARSCLYAFQQILDVCTFRLMYPNG